MNIRASKENQKSLMDFFPIKDIKDWPEETVLTIGIWVDVKTPEETVQSIKNKLALSLGVSVDTIDCADGGTGQTVIFAEIMVNKGVSDIHAVDWIQDLQDKVDRDFKSQDLVCGVILDKAS